MKRKLNLFLGISSSLFVLSGCDGLSFFKKIFSKAPIFTGMEISTDLPATRAKTNTKYLGPAEEFVFEIHFDNPKSYEIQSFTINDVKYTSYMFERGSTLDTIYLKSKTEIEEGPKTYKIDAIKYLDGEKIKDVTIEGNQTATIVVDIPYRRFENYKCVEEVKEGGRYLLGVYKNSDQKIRFITGDYHRDSNGPWSYYMATTENTLEGAVEVEAHYVTPTEFTLKVIAPDMVWDNKYISFYPGTGYYARIPSIVGLDNPGDKDFTVYSGDKIEEKTGVYTVSKFTYCQFYDEHFVETIVANYPVTTENNKAFDILVGTSGDYTSVDSKRADIAFDSDYTIAHLYEKIDGLLTITINKGV